MMERSVSIEIGDQSMCVGVQGLPVNRTLLTPMSACASYYQSWADTGVWQRQDGEIIPRYTYVPK